MVQLNKKQLSFPSLVNRTTMKAVIHWPQNSYSSMNALFSLHCESRVCLSLLLHILLSFSTNIPVLMFPPWMPCCPAIGLAFLFCIDACFYRYIIRIYTYPFPCKVTSLCLNPNPWWQAAVMVDFKARWSRGQCKNIQPDVGSLDEVYRYPSQMPSSIGSSDDVCVCSYCHCCLCVVKVCFFTSLTDVESVGTRH